MTDSLDLDDRGTDLPAACLSMTSLLQPFVDDELEGDDRELVAQHIADCSVCLVEVQQQQHVRAALRQLEPETIPETLLARIRAGLDEVDAEFDSVVVLAKPSRMRAFARGVGMMLPAAAAAAALFFVVQDGGTGEGANARDALSASAPLQSVGSKHADEPNTVAASPDAPIPVPQAMQPSVAGRQSLPAGIELVGGQPRVGGGAYEYADQNSGLRFRDQLRPLAEGRPSGTRQMYRGQAYFLSHDQLGHAQVEIEVGDIVHRLVQLETDQPSRADRIELSLDEPTVQRLVMFAHALHGAKAP